MSVNGFVNKFNKDASDYLNGRLKIARFAAPFQRFRYDFPGLCESRYYLLSAGTKGGKTQATVHVIADAITQYMSTLLNGHFPEVKPCFVYIPLEESENDILARLYSWFFFNVLGERVDKDEIVFSSPKVCNDSVIKIQNLMNDDRTKLFTEVLDECFCVKEVANFNDVMTVLYSITRVCDSDDMNSYFFFAGNGLTKDTTVDLPCMVTHEGQANLRMVIIDHVSLLPLASGEKLKGTIDKLSTILVYIRNKFKISSWVVQQQNKETYNASAKSSGEIEPSVSGLADSSYTARDCNLFLALSNPYYFKLNSYKSFHDLDLFGDGIRFLSIVANRNGVPGGWIGLEFDGCCQTFTELPKQSDVENFEAARERIRLRQFQIG